MNRTHLENILGERIISIQGISGGDIAHAQKIETASQTFFVKSAGFPDAKVLFEREVAGLRAIEKTNTIDVPKILGTYDVDGISCLILEYIEPKSPDSEDCALLGWKLAKLHTARVCETFGFEMDNFIGMLPQSNTFGDDWATFYVEHRLLAQLRIAFDRGRLAKKQLPSTTKMMSVCTDLFEKVEPCLLHGDLWSGNYLISDGGTPFLIDPAVYYGHNEVDLAMTKLFGGFSDTFYGAYHEIVPPHKNQKELIDIYQLYYILVHLNFFGSSYLNSVVQILKKYFP